MAGGEERIVVSVRLRPVNAREAERGDGAEWECSGPTTLKFLGTIPERAMFPATYTYGTHARTSLASILAAIAKCSFLHSSTTRQGVQPGVQHGAGVRGRGQGGGPLRARRNQLYARYIPE
jgi:hypothetical protein